MLLPTKHNTLKKAEAFQRTANKIGNNLAVLPSFACRKYKVFV
jgi:hypothetical protein